MAASASLCYHFNGLIKPSLVKRNNHQVLQVKAESFRDEGRLSNNNLVDANLRVLRERIEKIQIKERLEKCCKCEYGWNYAAGYDYKLKRNKEFREFFQLAGLVGGTIGFTCLSCTVFLCLFSMLINLSQ